MKAVKILGALALAGCLLLTAAALAPRLCFKGGRNYTFYCGHDSSDCKEVVADGNAALARLTLKEVCGESVVYDNFDLEDFLKEVGGKVLFTEAFSDDSVNYYCSANLPYSVKVKGQEVNLHVCVRGNVAKAGSPIIFGGY